MKSNLYYTKMYAAKNVKYVFVTKHLHFLKNSLYQLKIASEKHNIKDGSIYFKRIQKLKEDREVTLFLNYCKNLSIDPFNFVGDNTKYKIVDFYKTPYRVDYIVNLDDYGARAKYIFDSHMKNLEEKSKLDLLLETFFNFRVVNDTTISFTHYSNISALEKYFTEDIEVESNSVKECIQYKPESRQLFTRMRTFLGLYFDHLYSNYTSDVSYETRENDILFYGSHAKNVIDDFHWYNSNNLLPCCKCGKLVSFAFNGYGIQSNKHSGCV